MVKKIAAGLLLVLTISSCRNLTDDDSYESELKEVSKKVQTESLTAKEVELYDYQKELKGKLTLYFTPEGTPGCDIPYMELSDFMKEMYKGDYTVIQNGSTYKIIPDKSEDSYITIDFLTGSVFYKNFATPDLDLVGDTSAISHTFLTKQDQADFSYSINLNEYNIPIKFENGHGFLHPSVIQLLLLIDYRYCLIYNGKYLVIDTGEAYLDEEYSNFLLNKKETWSQEFADFSYNFLCLALDMNYGRKDYIGVTKFDDWFKNTGRKYDLCSTNIETAERTLAEVIYQDIADNHTYYVHGSPYSGLAYDSFHNVNVLINDWSCPVEKSPVYKLYTDITLHKLYPILYNSKKSGVFDEGWYNFIGIYIPRKVDSSSKYNTIILNLEHFEADRSISQYKDFFLSKNIGELSQTSYETFFFQNKLNNDGTLGNLEPISTEDCNTLDKFIELVKEDSTRGYGISLGWELGDSNNSVSLAVVANYIIKKLNQSKEHPIENVVMDLSLCGGGTIQEEAFLASWFLGKSIYHITNTRTGAKGSLSYVADVDFDGIYNTTWNSKIDSDDNICDLKRYAILSHFTFSASNFFAADMASSGEVKLFGGKSGGGNCKTHHISMPSGTYFVTSSNIKINILNNGSYLDLDNGIDVDQTIKPDEFDKVYDRETFCKEYL